MPTGSWFSSLSGTSRGSSSPTGTGAASQPKGFGGLAGGDRQGHSTGGAGGAPSTVDWGRTASSTPNASAPAVQLRQQVDGWGGGQSQGFASWFNRGQAAIPPPAPYSPLGGVRGLVDTMYGPQSQILADTLARQHDQMGMIGVDSEYRSDALRRDTALNQERLGLDREGVGLDRQGLNLDRQSLGINANQTRGELANLDKLRGILQKQYGINDEQLANQLAQLGIDEAKLRDMSKRELWDMRSNLTSRGAFNTIANERGTGRNARDLMYGLGTIGNQRGAADISHRSNRLGLDEKGIGLDNQQLGLTSRLANIGVDLDRIGLNDKRLDLKERGIGLSEQELANGLEDGLYQIGLQGQVSLNSLLDAIGGTNTQQAQLATTILQQMLQFSGLPPDVIAELMRALAPPAPPTSQPTSGRARSGGANTPPL